MNVITSNVEQVSDAELEDIVKMGNKTLMPPPEGALGALTQSLLGDYSKSYLSSLQTPLRTPMEENIILQEARNARAVREMTPFVASEREDMVLPDLYSGTGFDGITPRSVRLATPSMMLNNIQTPSSDLREQSSTLRIASSVNDTPMSTLSNTKSDRNSGLTRDQYGLNDFASRSSTSVMLPQQSGSSTYVNSEVLTKTELEKNRKNFKSKIAVQIEDLPEPEFSYVVAVPDEVMDSNEKDIMASKPKDAADVKFQQDKEQVLERISELNRRSTVLKRSLLRPVSINSNIANFSGIDMIDISSSNASKLIYSEFLKMIAHDDITFPDLNVTHKKRLAKVTDAPSSDIRLESIADEFLEGARKLLAEEMKLTPNYNLNENLSNSSVISTTDFGNIWNGLFANKMYLVAKDGKATYLDISSAQKQEV